MSGFSVRLTAVAIVLGLGFWATLGPPEADPYPCQQLAAALDFQPHIGRRIPIRHRRARLKHVLQRFSRKGARPAPGLQARHRLGQRNVGLCAVALAQGHPAVPPLAPADDGHRRYRHFMRRHDAPRQRVGAVIGNGPDPGIPKRPPARPRRIQRGPSRSARRRPGPATARTEARRHGVRAGRVMRPNETKMAWWIIRGCARLPSGAT